LREHTYQIGVVHKYNLILLSLPCIQASEPAPYKKNNMDYEKKKRKTRKEKKVGKTGKG
jgi:hypothetical protein